MRSTALALILVLTSAACSVKRTAPQELPSATVPKAFVVTTEHGTFSSDTPASLDVSFGPTARVELKADAAASGRRWGLLALLQEKEVASGHMTATIQNGPLDVGQATVQTRRADAGVVAETGGTVVLSLASGRITGTISAQPGGVPTRFEGLLSVSCWVPRRALGLGEPTNGLVPGAGFSEPLLLDAAFITPQCMPLRALKSPPHA
jgi:hypothetical protein